MISFLNMKTNISFWKYKVPKILIQRHRPDSNFAEAEVEELIAMLRETENLEEQGDILQYLVDTQGLDFNTGNILIFYEKRDFHKDSIEVLQYWLNWQIYRFYWKLICFVLIL